MSVNTYYKNNNCELYQCNNLELLKQLPDDHVDLIYCDILYGTGKNFGDYQDLKPNKNNIEIFYIPRLKEMYRILKNNGSIFIHMDYRIVHWIRCIMDDIFGYKNFRNEIIWDYNRWTGKSNNKLQCMHDNILFYAKGNNIVNHQFEKIKNPKLYQNKKDKDGTVLKNEDGTVKYFPQYERQIDDVWHIDILNPRAKERCNYFSQKPKELIERIIKIASNEGDIVADFFMGSGTTGEVALELSRKFIGCDIGGKACEITKERIEKIFLYKDVYKM